MTIQEVMEEIRFRFGEARAKAECNAAIAPNSYGAGYDLGYSDALGELLECITDAVGGSPHPSQWNENLQGEDPGES